MVRWVTLACVAVALTATFASRGIGEEPAEGHNAAVSAASTLAARIEGNDASLHAFYEALAATSQHQRSTRVLYLGDSHVANDRPTERLRERLQARFGDGGLGYFYPARPFHYYRHAGVSLRGASAQGWQVVARDRQQARAVGFGGYALVAADGASALSFNFTPALRQTATLTVHTLATEASHALDVLVDNAPVVAQPLPDATRLRAYVVDVPQSVESIRVQASEAQFAVLGVAHEYREPGVIVDAAGVVGARSGDLLRSDRDVLIEHVQARSPDLMILAFGTNDAMDTGRAVDDHVREIEALVTFLRIAAPSAACLLLGPTDHPQRAGRRNWIDRAQTKRVIAAQRVVAERQGCAFIDMVALTGGPLSMLELGRRDPPLGARDRIHFTTAGYHAIGNAIADALLQGFDAHCRLP